MSSSLIGRRLGKYEITELIGQGGMATVYKGYQPDIDRFVAIKVLPPHPGRDPNFGDRFRLEARTIAQLQHPHILPIHDYGAESDIIYLVMPFLDGGSVKDQIDEGPMSLTNAEGILRQVAAAVDYAHRRGVIHRDIKPDNILLDSEGNAMLADFGIVKILEGDANLTATGGILGTPAYMAPEQSQGDGISPQADIYSLGVIVYEMLTGQQPYQADTPMQVMLKHITDPVPRISDVSDQLPPAVEPVMMRVLAKNPEERYESATAFAQAFLRAMHNNEEILLPTGTANVTRETVAEATVQHQDSIVTNTPSEPMTMVDAPRSNTTEVPQSQHPVPVQTIITSPNNTLNTALLVGGMAIIALLAVIVVLLVVNNGSRDATPEAPTQAAAAASETNTPLPVATVATQAAVAPTSRVKTFGSLSYSTSANLGDTVNVQVNGLAPPGSGRRYVVWLGNTDDDKYLNIGTLTLDGLGNGIHQYVDRDELGALPALFNSVVISAEEEIGDAPAGEIVYSGKTPESVRDALHDIFVTSEEGFSEGSLYGGALAEAELAVIHTSFDHGNHDRFGLVNRTEHTMNVLMNSEVDYDSNDLAENPGFGVGVPAMLDAIEGRMEIDFSQPGLPHNIRSDVVRVQACINNVRNRLNDLFELETGWTEIQEEVSEEFAQSEIRKSEALIAGMIEGVDMNSNNQIEGFPGECGLRQIPAFGLLIGSLDLVEGNVLEA